MSEASANGSRRTPPRASAPGASAARNSPPARSRGSWLGLVLILAVTLGSVVVVFLPVGPEAVGIAASVLMLMLIFLKVPIAIAMLVPGLLGMYALRDERVVISMLSTAPYLEIASWTLSVLPMFVLMGLLLWRAGLTDSIYEAGRRWLSWLPGGLAVGTNVAGTGLSAVSGSTMGTTFALARIGIPEMLKSGYSPRFAVGAVAVSSLPGQLIPPSILMVLYAGIAEVPVSSQLLAGVLPGLVVSAAFTVTIVLYAVFARRFAFRDGAPAAQPAVSWPERWRSLAKIWPVPAIILVIFVGMFSGVFTATEAGAIAAALALVVTFIWKRKGGALSAVKDAAVGAVAASGSIFFILIGLAVLSRMYSMAGIDRAFASWITDMEMDRIQFLLVMALVYLVMGTFMEALPMMVLTVPILAPTLASMDISPLWFGVFVVFMGELAVLSPPVGILTFIIYGIAKDREVNLGHRITIKDIYVALLAFTPVALVIILILIFFPELATWIPEIALQNG